MMIARSHQSSQSRDFVYLLTPVNTAHPDWDSSFRTKPVQVVAWSSDNAKEIASRYYTKRAELAPGDRIIYQPWWNIDLVRTKQQIQNDQWPVICQSDTPIRFQAQSSSCDVLESVDPLMSEDEQRHDWEQGLPAVAGPAPQNLAAARQYEPLALLH